MPSTAAIARYLAAYHSGLLDRALTADERILTEEVLVDFMIDEPMLDHGSPIALIRGGLVELQALSTREGASEAGKIVERLCELIEELTGRLARQEHANDIMREHLAVVTTPAPSAFDQPRG